METIDWTDVLDSIEADSCVLFVGPYAFKNEAGETIEQALSKYLKLEKVEEGTHRRIKRYYKDDDLFFFKKEGYQDRVAGMIREFYEKEFQPQAKLLHQIAQIPFSLIVNLNPDRFIQKTFDAPEISLPYYHDFYDKSGAIPKKYIQPEGKKPLIYNLLGYIGKEESLILTHDNLFDYLQSLFAENKMHKDLKSYIQNAHAYIFLGLPIDKWYTQLLLRLLKLNHKSKNELDRLAAANDNLNTIIYKEQFHFNIQNITADAFIESLFEECKEEDLLKSLDEKHQRKTFDTLEVKSLLADGEFMEAVELLEEMLLSYQPRSGELLNSLLLQKVSLKTLENNKNLNIVENYDIKKGQLLNNFINFLDDEVAVQMEEIAL